MSERRIPFKGLLLKVYGVYAIRKTKLKIGLYHLRRSLKYCYNTSTRNGWVAAMRTRCHVIEKGLTMPDIRYGFGQPRILDIVEMLNDNRNYENEGVYKYTVGLLKEYLDFHDRNGKILPNAFRKTIEELTSRYPDVKAEQQIDITSEEYYSNIDSAFPFFCRSRRTVRYFEKPAPIADVQEAVELAGYAPSACNRQSIKCHYFEGEIVKKILSIQKGNKGFGHLAPQLFILTSDVSMMTPYEYNDSFTNAGIFAMNLSYALYYKQIASCILTWSVLPEDDLALREIADIPKVETIVLLIIFGKTPREFRIAKSKRQQVNEFLIMHI